MVKLIHLLIGAPLTLVTADLEVAKWLGAKWVKGDDVLLEKLEKAIELSHKPCVEDVEKLCKMDMFHHRNLHFDGEWKEHWKNHMHGDWKEHHHGDWHDHHHGDWKNHMHGDWHDHHHGDWKNHMHGDRNEHPHGDFHKNHDVKFPLPPDRIAHHPHPPCHHHSNPLTRRHYLAKTTPAPLAFPPPIALCLRSQMSSLSDACRGAIEYVDKIQPVMQERVDDDDRMEWIFRAAVVAVAVLSMVVSYLLIMVRVNTPVYHDLVPTPPAEKFCFRLNAFLCVVLFGIMVVFCPFFLLVVIPSFGIVQVVYYGCFHKRRQGAAAAGAEYQMVEPSDDPNQVYAAVVVDMS